MSRLLRRLRMKSIPILDSSGVISRFGGYPVNERVQRLGHIRDAVLAPADHITKIRISAQWFPRHKISSS
jgi:hypothetical protein